MRDLRSGVMIAAAFPMLTVGGLLLGAMLAASPAEPIDPSQHRVTTVHREPSPAASDARDPFAPDAHARARAPRPRPAAAPIPDDLPDPFEAARQRRVHAADPALAPQASELRDPFGR